MGKFRHHVLEALKHSSFASRIIYEAPRTSQQVFLLNNQGHEVNLGNIPVDHVLSLETLRQGLRADTLGEMNREEECINV